MKISRNEAGRFYEQPGAHHGKTHFVRPSQTDAQDPLLTLIAPHEVSCAYISLTDVDEREREAWLAKVFQACEQISLTAPALDELPEVTDRPDAFVVGGTKPYELVFSLLGSPRVMRSCMKIALVSDMPPEHVAKLLNAGFDDVFDITRMDPVEAIARLRAILRRYL